MSYHGDLGTKKSIMKPLDQALYITSVDYLSTAFVDTSLEDVFTMTWTIRILS